MSLSRRMSYVMSQAVLVLEAQASLVIVNTRSDGSGGFVRATFSDVERNADLYVFSHEVAHG